MLQTFLDSFPELVDKSCRHLFLACLSTLAAIMIGVPVGILVAKRPAWKTPILTVVNIFQTIPSIALLAFLLPFLGIGIKPALVTLTLYAILPIVRNTHTGLEGIPKDLIEAADSIGFKPLQKLRLVELPICLPVMIAGIRTSAVMCVGIATIAAFIGAGGLGDFIFQGISTDNTPLVLMGAIPAAFLALVMDFGLGKIENFFSATHRAARKHRWLPKGVAATAILASISVIAFYVFSFHSPRKQEIIIGTKDFTEQFILGEMIAQILEEKTSFTVTRKFNLGNTDVCHKSMLSEDIDLYPEYTGTGLFVVLKENFVPSHVFDYVNSEYQKKHRMKWIHPFGFNNLQNLSIKKALSKEKGIQTISDLAALQSELVIAAPPEFLSRPDAYDTLQTGYSITFKEIRQMVPALMYPAIEDGYVDVIVSFSTDARFHESNLINLKDDKHLFIDYQAAIVVREEALKRHPEIETHLFPLSGLIDEETMRILNYQVEVEKLSPYQVAKGFLTKKGVLKK